MPLQGVVTAAQLFNLVAEIQVRPTGNHFSGYTEASDFIARSFFHFDLGPVRNTVLSASLKLKLSRNFHFGGTFGYRSEDPTETFGLFDFTGDLASLIQGSGGMDAYDDLGNGTQFGGVVLSKSDEGSVIIIDLDNVAVMTINSNSGSSIAFGGAVTTLSGQTSNTEAVFGDSHGTSLPSQLILEIIPEPSTVYLIGVGIAMLSCRCK